MIFKKINCRELVPFEPYLFKIVAASEVLYTIGYLDSFNGYMLDRYQYLADRITGYVEIRDDSDE